jgi:hypothetical protein
MNIEYLIILTILFTFLMLVIQRSESAKRRVVLLIMVPLFILIRNFVVYREVESEAWAALGIAFVLNFLFWLLIGRYNPVASSDDIRVLGLDD